MSTTARTEALDSWFRSQSGALNSNIRIVEDETSGVHGRATASLEPGFIVSAPNSITLSYLNALVDDAVPFFHNHRSQLKVETIGFFYLMVQYVNRNTSFWSAYIGTLPDPKSGFSQPLFFEDAEDVAWLEGTDVWHTITARKEVYKKYYVDGVALLEQAGVDIEPYTWDLFKWSVTIFSSRSFSSRAIRPQDGSKVWTTYKCLSDRRRQAVQLDMSNAPIGDLKFPVLFPALDVLNHDHTAQVDWTFGSEAFKIHTNYEIAAGEEVWNNYGPKGNDELLLGYGFCIPDNSNDSVALTLKPLPEDVQVELRKAHPGFFTPAERWSSEKATFRLKKAAPVSTKTLDKIFEQLSAPLLELLVYTLRHERRLPFAFLGDPLSYLTDPDSDGHRYLPHIARMLVQSLAPKHSNLQNTTPTATPNNTKQRQASIYRQSQINIIVSWISALRTYTRSLIWLPSTPSSTSSLLGPKTPCLAPLESFLSIIVASNPNIVSDFLAGIEASANTRNIDELREAGWEEDVWVLLICYLSLCTSHHGHVGDAGWFNDSEIKQYISQSSSDVNDNGAVELEQAGELMEIVTSAAAACPHSLWSHEMWSPKFIASVGGSIWRFESFMVMCPSTAVRTDAERPEDARLCIYLHSLS